MGEQPDFFRVSNLVVAFYVLYWTAKRKHEIGFITEDMAEVLTEALACGEGGEAANACLTAHGGYGFAAEYDVERKFRETRLLTLAPVSNNLVLAFLGQHVLGMPKSY